MQRKQDRRGRRMRRWTLTLAACAFAVATAGAGESPLQDVLLDQVLEDLGERDWLLADPQIREPLLRRAAARGQALHVVPVVERPGTDDATWREAVAGLESEELEWAAELGPVVFVRAWLQRAPDEAARRLGTLTLPDLWAAAGLQAQPAGLLFVGGAREEMSEAALDALLERHRALWDTVSEWLIDTQDDRSPATNEARLRLRRQVGWVANNLGVMLQRAGRLETAFEVFTRARMLDPQNVSALLNRAVCVRRGVRPELAEQVSQELDGLRHGATDARALWGLTQVYGQVLHPEDFLPLGWVWAISGIPAADRERWEAVLDAVPEENRDSVRDQLARTHAGQMAGSDEDMRWLELTRDEAQRKSAFAVLSRRALVQGRLDGAERFLGLAEAAGLAPMTVAIESATLVAARGDRDAARELLERAAADHPEAWQPWALLATLSAEAQDAEGLERAIQGMEAVPEPDTHQVQVARGRLLMLQGRPGQARDTLLRALEQRPDNVALYDLILPLDFALGDKRSGEQHALALLRAMPNHAFANYIVATLLLERRELQAAEVHFRRSIETSPTPHALNDYGVLLIQTGRPAEAEQAARAALERHPDLAVALDTLATALRALDREDEAFEALSRAVNVDGGDDPRIQLNWAKALLDRGRTDEAREASDKAHRVRSALSPSERQELLQLRDALQRGR